MGKIFAVYADQTTVLQLFVAFFPLRGHTKHLDLEVGRPLLLKVLSRFSVSALEYLKELDHRHGGSLRKEEHTDIALGRG
jgi:hypothetical protein